VAEGLDAHALEEHGAERQRKYEPSRRRKMGAWAR
jgi:DnaJ-domain-containing protein 1